MGKIHPQNTVEGSFARKQEVEKDKVDTENDVTDAHDMYWSYNMYVLGVGPAIFSLITVSIVNTLARITPGCETFEIRGNRISGLQRLFLTMTTKQNACLFAYSCRICIFSYTAG